MLYHYMTNSKEELQPVHMIAGFQNEKDDSGVPKKTQRFKLVPDSTLEESKNTIDVVTTIHVYSLQRVLPKDTTSVLHQLDTAIYLNEWSEYNRWSALKCSRVANLKNVALVALQEVETSASRDTASSVFKKEAAPEKAKPKGKKMSTSSFFDTTNTKNKKINEKKPSETKSPTLTIDSKQKLKPTSSTSTSTSTPPPTTKPTTKPSSSKTQSSGNDTNKRKSKVIADSDDEDDFSSDADMKPKEVKKEATPKKEAVKSKQPTTPTTTPKTESKKRANDADSSSDVKTEVGSASQKRFRKIIRKEQRTHMDDKGFLVTEVVDVEDEEEIVEQPTVARSNSNSSQKASSQKSKPSHQKKKQGNIMSFFGKKK